MVTFPRKPSSALELNSAAKTSARLSTSGQGHHSALETTLISKIVDTRLCALAP